MSKLKAFFGAALVAGALVCAQAAPAHSTMYWGATISGEPYGQMGTSAPDNQSAWDLFEKHAGKKVALLNMSQAWVTFDKTEMDLTWNRGAIPVVTMTTRLPP